MPERMGDAKMPVAAIEQPFQGEFDVSPALV